MGNAALCRMQLERTVHSIAQFLLDNEHEFLEEIIPAGSVALRSYEAGEQLVGDGLLERNDVYRADISHTRDLVMTLDEMKVNDALRTEEEEEAHEENERRKREEEEAERVLYQLYNLSPLLTDGLPCRSTNSGSLICKWRKRQLLIVKPSRVCRRDCPRLPTSAPRLGTKHYQAATITTANSLVAGGLRFSPLLVGTVWLS